MNRTMKRIGGLLLALVMVVGLLPVTTLVHAAVPASATAILPGDRLSATISTSGESVYFSFTPTVTETYEFYTTGSMDTIGYLYDADDNEIANNDDGGENYNCKISTTLTAGTTYYLKVYLYSGIGSFTVCLDRIHSWTGAAVSNNDGTHTKTCATCGETVTESCASYYTVTYASGVATYTCSECGYSYSEAVSGPFPLLTWSFENTDDGWTFVDGNGDGYTWTVTNSNAYDGSYSVSSKYNSSMSVDEWAISPAIDMSGLLSATLSVWLKEGNANWGDEHFALYAGTSSDPGAMTMLTAEITATLSYQNYTADLSDYLGLSEVYVAIRHYDTQDAYYLYMDYAQIIGEEAGECTSHVLELHPAVAAGCTTAGNSAYYQCATCGKVYLDAAGQQQTALSAVTIPALGHDWSGWVSNSDGTHTRSCSRCHDTETDSCVYGEAVYGGVMKNECLDCGYSVASTVSGDATRDFWGFESDPDGVWTFLDADGDGYAWQWNQPTYASFTTYEGSGILTSASYVNNVGAIEPDNWAISPMIDLTGCAEATLSLWARGQDNTGYEKEHFALYAGFSDDPDDMIQLTEEYVATDDYLQYTADLSALCGSYVYVAIRHYNCTDQYWLNVDNVEIIATYPAVCNMHSLVQVAAGGATCTEPGTSQAYYRCTLCERTFADAQGTTPLYLPDLATESPLGHDWGAWTVTTPATCTTEGVETATCSRCSATVTRPISVSGHTLGDYVDNGDGTHSQTCSVCQEVVSESCTYEDRVENGVRKSVCAYCGHTEYDDSITGDQKIIGWYFEEEPTDWTFVDKDGDGYNWSWVSTNTGIAYEGNGWITSASFINNIGALTPDNWAISPAIHLQGCTDPYVTLWAKGRDSGYYSEVFGIFVGETPDPDAMVQVGSDITTTADYQQYTADLSAFAGKNVYIAIRHYNCNDQYWLDVDAVEVWGTVETACCANGAHTLSRTRAVRATCTEWGNSAYFRCTTCGRYYFDSAAAKPAIPDDVLIEPLGHDWGAWTSNGDGTHSRVCGNDATHVETEACSYENGLCTVCGASDPSMMDASLVYDQVGFSVEGAIKAQFAVYGWNHTNPAYESYYLLVNHHKADGTEESSAVQMTANDLGNGYTIYVGYYDVVATYMADDLDVTVYGMIGSDVYTGPTTTTSIRAIACTALDDAINGASPSAAKATVYANMLAYGAQAQTKFGYNTGDLANALTGTDLDNYNASVTTGNPTYAELTETVTTPAGMGTEKVTVFTRGLSVEERVYLQFGLYYGNYDPADFTIELKVGTREIAVTAADLVAIDATNYPGYYALIVDSIDAVESATPVSLTVYEGTTPVSKTYIDTIEHLAATKTGDDALLAGSMVNFYQSINALLNP